jgi:hypothetical protein
LEAAPFIGPRLSTARSDNEALGIFDAGYPGAVEVDIALYELRDYRVTADVDRYRGHMLEYEALLEERRLLEKSLPPGGLSLLAPVSASSEPRPETVSTPTYTKVNTSTVLSIIAL